MAGRRTSWLCGLPSGRGVPTDHITTRKASRKRKGILQTSLWYHLCHQKFGPPSSTWNALAGWNKRSTRFPITDKKDSHIKRGELSAIPGEWLVVKIGELLRDCVDIGHCDEQSPTFDWEIDKRDDYGARDLSAISVLRFQFERVAKHQAFSFSSWLFLEAQLSRVKGYRVP